jgi:hypothetical protein
MPGGGRFAESTISDHRRRLLVLEGVQDRFLDRPALIGWSVRFWPFMNAPLAVQLDRSGDPLACAIEITTIRPFQELGDHGATQARDSSQASLAQLRLVVDVQFDFRDEVIHASAP